MPISSKTRYARRFVAVVPVVVLMCVILCPSNSRDGIASEIVPSQVYTFVPSSVANAGATDSWDTMNNINLGAIQYADGTAYSISNLPPWWWVWTPQTTVITTYFGGQVNVTMISIRFDLSYPRSWGNPEIYVYLNGGLIWSTTSLGYVDAWNTKDIAVNGATVNSVTLSVRSPLGHTILVDYMHAIRVE